MFFLRFWATTDRRILAALDESVLEVFQSHIQNLPSDHEAGGLLLGTVHGSHMIITEVTVPTQKDKQSRFLFERMPFGHKAIAEARWCASGGIIRYLGEWHTHPQDHPLPSGLDRTEWAVLAGKRADGRPMLAVIVGRQGLHVEFVSPNGSGQIMESIF
jgi:integrative and conjugative element protein (TIGR02256 family)